MKWKELLSVVSFLLIPIVVAVGFGVWFYIQDLQSGGTPLAKHPQRGWQLPQNSAFDHGHNIQRDANGMRPTQRSGKTHLVYTMGDSNIFGHGLSDEETLHGHLTKEFERVNISAEAITGAVPGYSSVQSLHQLNAIGWKLNPKLLIVGNLWSDNDIITADESPDIKEEDDSFWGLDLFIKDSISKIGLTEGWENRRGFRRVAPTRYGKALDTIALKASQRGVAVLFLSPCNYALIEENDRDEYAWDVYFKIMADVADYRSVPFVSGCEVLKKNNLTGRESFLDEMHPTSKLNAAYAKQIVQVLTERQWPKQSMLPSKDLPLYSKEWKDSWPKAYPEPKGNSTVVRPDNMDF